MYIFVSLMMVHVIFVLSNCEDEYCSYFFFFFWLQDGFRDDSLRIMRDIEKSSPHCQVCLYY